MSDALSGLLCYDDTDIARNRWFIDRLLETAESEGISLRLCSVNDLRAETPSADFLCNRSRHAEISEFYEEHFRIPVFNHANVSRITNDKYRTYLFLRENGLPVADTLLVGENTILSENLRPPLVAKPLDGHGGAGVALLSDETALKDALRTHERPFLLQEPMLSGWDLRVYVMDGSFYAAVLRTAKGRFCANFSLGADVRALHPDSQILLLAARVTKRLPLDFAGIDFLQHPKGGYVIGEIEDVVGCRMLYQTTALDPARDFIHMIAQKLKHL